MTPRRYPIWSSRLSTRPLRLPTAFFPPPPPDLFQICGSEALVLPLPPLEFPHLLERKPQRLGKLGNGVHTSFPRPALHLPYGGRGYPALLREHFYTEPLLLPYPL